MDPELSHLVIPLYLAVVAVISTRVVRRLVIWKRAAHIPSIWVAVATTVLAISLSHDALVLVEPLAFGRVRLSLGDPV